MGDSLEDGKLYTFHENSIIKYNIKENFTLEKKNIYQALNDTEREQIKNKIIVLLSYRHRSKKELKDFY